MVESGLNFDNASRAIFEHFTRSEGNEKPEFVEHAYEVYPQLCQANGMVPE